MTYPAERIPLPKMLGVFLATLIAANLVLGLVSYVFPDFEIPGSIGVALHLVAATVAGGAAARATDRRLTAGEKFSFAVASTILTILLAIALICAMLAYFGVPITLQNAVLGVTGQTISDSEIGQYLPWIGLFVIVVSLAVSYFGVGLGASSEIKRREKLEAKGK